MRSSTSRSASDPGTGKTSSRSPPRSILERDAVERIVLTRRGGSRREARVPARRPVARTSIHTCRPLYDALYDLIGYEQVARHRSTGRSRWRRSRSCAAHVVPLLRDPRRGPEHHSAQMKMFLTRIGFGLEAVVTGDVTQIDLPAGRTSGLVDARARPRRVRGIACHRFAPRTSCAIRWCRRSSTRTTHTKRARRPRAATGVANERRGRARAALAVQYAAPRSGLPARASVASWLAQALPGRRARITVRFVGQDKSRRLNRDYRGRDYATNVLTFAYGRPRARRRHRAVRAGDRARVARALAARACALRPPGRARRAASRRPRPRARPGCGDNGGCGAPDPGTAGVRRPLPEAGDEAPDSLPWTTALITSRPCSSASARSSCASPRTASS